MLQPGIVVAKYQKDDQHCGQANRDRQARPEQHTGNHCQWSHVVFSDVDYELPQSAARGYAKYALDRSAPSI